jgi:hypothetical protein
MILICKGHEGMAITVRCVRSYVCLDSPSPPPINLKQLTLLAQVLPEPQVSNHEQAKGYRVAMAARSLKPEDSTDDKLHLSVDLSNPDSIGPAFSSLRKQWGEPSVVFYNGMPMQLSPEIPWIINTY